MKKTILKSLPLITISLISFLAVILIGAAQVNAQLNFEAQVPIPGMEGTVPVGTKAGGVIQSTLLGEYVKNIYNYSFAVAGILAAVVLMGGGVMWLVSGGNQSSISKAKSIIGGSLIGLGILFSAYILLRTINPALLEMKPISIDNISEVPSKSNGMNCCVCKIDVKNIVSWAHLTPDQYHSCNSNIGLTEEECLASCEQWARRVEIKQFFTKSDVAEYSFEVNKTCGSDDQAYQCVNLPENNEYLIYNSIFESEGWAFDTGIEDQIKYMSPELAQFLNCMRSNLPEGVGRISSISDSKVADPENNLEMEDCNQSDCPTMLCAHMCQSCHYGGGIFGANESYAIDLGDEENYNLFLSAAKQCDGGAYVLKEDNHIHISVSKCPKQ